MFFSFCRLPVVSDCPAGQTARVTSNLHSSSSSSSSTMAVSRVPSPPLPEVNTPVAENWCYTQVSSIKIIFLRGFQCVLNPPKEKKTNSSQFIHWWLWGAKDHFCDCEHLIFSFNLISFLKHFAGLSYVSVSHVIFTMWIMFSRWKRNSFVLKMFCLITCFVTTTVFWWIT